jgi:uncharacterized protein (DUF885 family)
MLLVTASCLNSNERSIPDTADLFSNLLHDYYDDRLRYFPLEATANADPRYNDQLPNDISESYRDTLRQFYTRYIQKLKTINRPELKGQNLISYDVLQYDLNMQLEGLNFPSHLMPVNQFSSMHLTFPMLGSGTGNQPFKTVQDYRNFLKRIDAFVIYQDTALKNMQKGMQLGIVPPKSLMKKVIPQYSSLIAKNPEESVFFGPVKLLPADFTQSDKKWITEEYTSAIVNKLNPCFKRMADFIENTYLEKCVTTSGISAIPQGKEYYNWLVRYWTTTQLNPDTIFEIGQREVNRLHAEMERVKSSTGFNGTLKDFFQYLHTNPKFFPFKKDSEVINAFVDIEERMKPKLQTMFNMVPKAKFEVRQTEAFREASASAEYIQAAPDGSRPGIFYVPVPDASKYNVVGMEDLFLHEAIPGHHYQISIQQENESLPEFRRFSWFGAYGEGWALYAESLGKELGLYTDSYQYFGCLSEEMHRAIRLVVDVGIHLKGWTREQAIQFSLDNEMESEADITAEIERYMAIPGQALAYKIGQLKILEMRTLAESKLKSGFSIQKFHDQVLINGCLPLEVFENTFRKWIKDQS